MRTNKGELTVARQMSFVLLNKSLLPLPEKFHGLTDQEQKLPAALCRSNHVNEGDPKALFQLRSQLLSSRVHREFFIESQRLSRKSRHADDAQFIPGGAHRPTVSRPTTTLWICRCFSRVAPELFLKRLGGWRLSSGCSRSTGTSAMRGFPLRHNPEFTMLEFYQAYADYRDLMDHEPYGKLLIRECCSERLLGGAPRCRWPGASRWICAKVL